MSSDDDKDSEDGLSLGPRRTAGRETSDMFRVEAVRKSIPIIKEVPLTREEVQRQKTIRIAIITAIVIATIAAVLFALHVRHRQAISAAATEAERTGRIAEIDAALAELEGEESAADVALRARLEAMAVLAGEGARRESAEALLARYPLGSDNASDHRIASTYLALAAGQPEAAGNHASSLVAGQGPRAAEAGHAR
ncbi:MAG: hypothetical protein J0L92_39095, partial [Deltaproteobacteria bacterium]|nr:hypothetical protein [Deltaproteobacteria bacterium]